MSPCYDNLAERNRRDFLERNRRTEFSHGRFGERAEYDSDEPRYSDYRGDLRNQNRDYPQERWRGSDSRAYGQQRMGYALERSRLRCRDIMTRDLAVANRDTPLNEVAVMMKQEDTGVIPVVEYQSSGGNGKTTTTRDETNYEQRTYGRGKLLGLITDRDIVIRAVATP